MDVEGWLHSLSLERYAQVFRANDIGPDVVPEPTDADLTMLGVSLGDRKRLLRAIAGLRKPESRLAARLEAARRQLTVMFVDLVGSTALSAGLDPEDMREILRDYVDVVAAAIARFDGHVARFLGDGVLAYFGFPQAHEDDAERAVRAGLDALDAVGRLRTPHGATLAARVGIATGLVVVGDLIGRSAAQEQMVVGDTPNLAARLQALAEPGTVVVAAATRRLLGELFELADLGFVEAKGFACRVEAFRVVGEGRAHGRFEALRRADATAPIGREQELGILLERWRRAQAGEGQAVLVAGEPGIGKSRLLHDLYERISVEPHTRLRYFCSPFHHGTAFHPILSQIERAARIGRDDPPTVKLNKLKALFAPADGSANDTATLTAALLDIAPGPSDSASTLSPQTRKSKLRQLWLDQLEALARRCPVLMLLEDAHWIDPTSLEQFDLVVDRIRRLPVLVVVTSRPEFHSSWGRYPHVATLTLDRLNRRQSMALIGQVTAGKPLPNVVLRQLVGRADGVPLFLEELAKAMLESGQLEDAGDSWRLAGTLPALTVPATLQDSLLARLDRLAPVRGVAQIAAAIGREFSRDLISIVSRLDDRTLDEKLGQLATAELIHQGPGDVYTFKHALVQEAAYATLLRSQRQLVHGQIAAALLGQNVEHPPELVAHHLSEAGQADRSVEFWAKAGQLAASRAASREAATHFERAIAQLVSLPDTITRQRREAALQDALGGALAHIAGVDSESLVQVYTRARDICQQTGDAKGQFIAEWNLWHIHIARYEHGRARALSEHLMTMAERENDPEMLLQALHVEWSMLSTEGRHPATRASCERGWALYDPERHGTHHLTYGAHDPGVCSRIVCAFEVWCLGEPEQALRCYEEGLALARRLGHPQALLHALAKGLPLFRLLRDRERLGTQAENVFRLAAEQDTANFGTEAEFMRAWVLSGRGEPERAVRMMQASLKEHCGRGATGISPYYMLLLARAQARAGALDESLVTMDAAYERARNEGSRWGEPDVLRIRGEILTQKDDQDGAERCFQAALALARSISGRAWELRAATSLGRLWARQGRIAEAREGLAPIYGAFTEGLDLPDLRDARALLAELA